MKPTETTAHFSFLVVDDDVDARTSLALTLEALGHSVTSAASANDALAKLQGEKFDMALIDIMMPGKNGYQLLGEVREMAAHKEMPVSIVSALDTNDELLHGYQQGADYYITKPFDTKQIRYAIEVLLGEEEAAD